MNLKPTLTLCACTDALVPYNSQRDLVPVHPISKLTEDEQHEIDAAIIRERYKRMKALDDAIDAIEALYPKYPENVSHYALIIH